MATALSRVSSGEFCRLERSVLRSDGAGSVLRSVQEVDGGDSVPKKAIFGLSVSSSGALATSEPVRASEFEGATSWRIDSWSKKQEQQNKHQIE